MKSPVALAAALAFALAASSAGAVEPGPVYSPHVEQGVWELEYRAFTVVDRGSDENGLSNHLLSLGYGATSFWWTEIVAEYARPRGGGGGWDAFEWENRFQFTEPGEYWADVGAIVELEKARRGNGKEAKVGLLFEKDIGDTTLRANWLVAREYGTDASSTWAQEYRAQWRWRYQPLLQPLVELQADTHAMNVGPGITGKAKIGTYKIEYTAAWLFRASGSTPQGLPRIELELEF